MVMPGDVYTEARLRARFHVQVELDHTVVDRTPGRVPVLGRVVRVFRGDEVRFSVPVCRDDDEIPPAGDLWTNLQSF